MMESNNQSFNVPPSDYRRVVRFLDFEKPTIWDMADSVFSLPAKVPYAIFHHTSIDALGGILETGYMRASRISDLNDYSEVKYGVAVLSEIFQEMRKNQAELTLSGDDKENMIKIFRYFLSSTEIPEYGGLEDLYSVSFTSECDLATQWNSSYGNGGRGVAIAMYMPQLIGAGYKVMNDYRILPVVYGRAEFEEKLIKLIDLVCDYVAFQTERRWFNPVAVLEWSQVFLMKALYSYMPFIKHPGFQDEREWRVLFMQSVRERMAYTKNGKDFEFLPFNIRSVSLPGCDSYLPISEVITGPCCSEDDRARVRRILDDADYGYVEVNPSSLPFRG